MNFEIMRYISKSKGFNNINYILKLLNKINLNKKNIIFIKNIFLYSKTKNYSLIYKLNYLNLRIKNYYTNLIYHFLEIQIKLLFMNKKLFFNNKKILNIIFQNLNISLFKTYLIISKLKYHNKYIDGKKSIF